MCEMPPDQISLIATDHILLIHNQLPDGSQTSVSWKQGRVLSSVLNSEETHYLTVERGPTSRGPTSRGLHLHCTCPAIFLLPGEYTNIFPGEYPYIFGFTIIISYLVSGL